MSDSHTSEGQIERAKRLRMQIERLQSGSQGSPEDHPSSLREKIEERAKEMREKEKKSSTG